MPFPTKPPKDKDEEEFEHFAEMLRPVFLHARLTDILKMAPYAKYMKETKQIRTKIKSLRDFFSKALSYYCLVTLAA